MSKEDTGNTPRKRMSAAGRRALIEAAATRLFGVHGYGGASIEAIARASGVTPPVIYEHFPSKLELYRALLLHHYRDLQGIWEEEFPGGGPPGERVARSFETWFGWVESNPEAARVLFGEPRDEPALSVHREVSTASRDVVMRLFAAQPWAEAAAGSLDPAAIEMAWVVLRGVLQGLALWWVDHPEVPRERVVGMALNSLWIGFERAQEDA